MTALYPRDKETAPQPRNNYSAINRNNVLVHTAWLKLRNMLIERSLVHESVQQK